MQEETLATVRRVMTGGNDARRGWGTRVPLRRGGEAVRADLSQI